MRVSIKWCLNNIQKAFKIHYFEGNIRQFKEVLIKANEMGIEDTVDIPQDLIDSIINKP
jgi:hypothetical protein